jgi:methylthioribose-1-phosphate isomerase
MSAKTDRRLRSSVTWADGVIEIIDQTRLPASLEILRLETVDEVIDAIRRLAVRGALAIGVCGGLGMAMGLQARAPRTVDEARGVLDALADEIGAARPTAVNLMWAARRVRDAAVAGRSVEEIHRLALDEALAILDEDREACRRIGEAGRSVLQGRDTILTHCNTGRLATLGWGTALGVVYAKAAAGEPVRVYACEARPLLQGARLTAWELMDAGIDVTLIADSAAAWLLASHTVDAVIVGADRIARNGDTANKIGTFALAIAARQAGVPFFVAAPSSTFDPAMATGADCVIEERSADEVRVIRGQRVAPERVPVWNPAFDVTPAELIAGFITEAGVLQPPFDRAAVAAMKTNPSRVVEG